MEAPFTETRVIKIVLFLFTFFLFSCSSAKKNKFIFKVGNNTKKDTIYILFKKQSNVFKVKHIKRGRLSADIYSYYFNFDKRKIANKRLSLLESNLFLEFITHSFYRENNIKIPTKIIEKDKEFLNKLEKDKVFTYKDFKNEKNVRLFYYSNCFKNIFLIEKKKKGKIFLKSVYLAGPFYRIQ